MRHTAGTIVCGNRDQSARIAHHGVGGGTQQHAEGLGGLRRAVVHQHIAQQLERFARSKRQRAALRVGVVKVVIADVDVGIGHADLLRAGRAQAHHHIDVASPLVTHSAFNGDRGGGHVGAVIGHDARAGAGLRNVHATGVAEQQAEQFVAFACGVVDDGHEHRARRFAWRKRHAAAARAVVASCGRKPILGCKVQAHQFGRRSVKHQHKGCHATFFIDRRAANADRGDATRTIVGGNGHRGPGVADDGVDWRCEPHVKALGGLGRRVAGQAVAQHFERLTGRK